MAVHQLDNLGVHPGLKAQNPYLRALILRLKSKLSFAEKP